MILQIEENEDTEPEPKTPDNPFTTNKDIPIDHH